MTTEDKLIKKIVKILIEHKFNSTQIETTEMTAKRIIRIIKKEMYDYYFKDFKNPMIIEKEDYENIKKKILNIINEFLKDKTYQNSKELPALIKFPAFEWEDFKQELNEGKDD